MKTDLGNIGTNLRRHLAGYAISANVAIGLMAASLIVYAGAFPYLSSRLSHTPALTGSTAISIKGLQYKAGMPDVDGGIGVIIPASQELPGDGQQLPLARPKPQRDGSAPEHRFNAIIVKAANQYDIDPALVKAVIKVESGYNPSAVSKRGAVGLMQLMPRTAKELGVKDSFNPEHNIDGGVRYLKKMMDTFGGNVRMALAAYNAGSKKVRRYQGVPPFKSTQYYLQKVFKYYHQYKNQMAKPVNSA